jgi:UPF0755 protein
MGGLCLFLLSAVLLTSVWVGWQLRRPYHRSPGSESFADIPRGASTALIADILVRDGALQYRLPFEVYVRWARIGRHLQAGEYRFSAPATPREVAWRLARGDVYYVSVTIPEGLTARETTQLLVSAGIGSSVDFERALQRTDWIRDLSPGAHDLEGYLFPDTYRFSRKATPEEVVKSMVDQFRSRFSRLIREYPVPPDWTPAQIVTLASLIEKEVRVTEERPVVSSVLVNRLERGMPLACDPTIIYALKLAGRYDGNIHKTDLVVDSPYNTYLHTGLPPTPICNPGAESIKAALAPRPSDYLYYVSRNDGTHQFSKDLKSHLSAVARYQKHRLPR